MNRSMSLPPLPEGCYQGEYVTGLARELFGKKRMELPQGSLIAMANEKGTVGNDYDGRLGPMSKWLLDHQKLFAGRRVLDLGSNACHFPLLYAVMGANHVTAVEGRECFKDLWEEHQREHWLPLSDKIEFQCMDVRDFHSSQSYDVVSCLGLLYHLHDGWDVIERIVRESKCGHLVLDSQLWEEAKDEIEPANCNTRTLREEEVPHPTKESVEWWLLKNNWTFDLVLRNWTVNPRGMWLVRTRQRRLEDA